MKAKDKLRVNDLCRVIQSGGGLGPTLFMVEWIGERGYCVIREAGKPLAGGQEFDLSLLKKVSRDDWGRTWDIKEGKIKDGPALLSKTIGL